MYSNALSGLASGMAGGGGAPEGMPGHETPSEGGAMVPCPVCQGTGMISEEMLFGGGGNAGLPPRLAARGGGMPMQMPPSSSPSPFPGR